jgi:phospholipase A-2-activating protein
LKLPYNLSQNPYEAATKFIQDNELPITYLDQVADFITTNTQGATVGRQPVPVDSAPDPWGSENRYRPGETNTPTSRSIPTPPKVLPQKEYLDIVVARIPAMQKKITELNQVLIVGGQKDIALNPTDLSVLGTLCRHLDSSGATKASQSVSGGLDLAIKLSTIWPYKDRLPGLDLLRLLVVAPNTATLTHPRLGNIIDILLAGATDEKPALDNHVMMVIRAFANLFQSEEGRVLAIQEFDKIQDLIATSVASTTNRNLLVAATTVYINYAVLFGSTANSTKFDQVLALIDTISKILSKQTDSEAVYRAMVAIGTLLTLDEEIKSAAKDVYGIEKCIATAISKASDPRIKNVAKEIGVLLS